MWYDLQDWSKFLIMVTAKKDYMADLGSTKFFHSLLI